jgi:hypothetical protein
MNMTEKQKQIFELIALAAKRSECERISLDLEFYNPNPFQGRMFGCLSSNGFSNKKLPFDVSDNLNEWWNEHNFRIDDEGLSYAELVIIPEKREIILKTIYVEIEPGVEQVTTHEFEDDDKVFNDLKEKGIKSLSFDFTGGGDSGYIEDYVEVVDINNEISKGNLSNFGLLENYLYGMLGDYDGWEINEGSQGSFMVNVKDRLIRLLFTWNKEVEYPDTYPIATY